MEIEFCPKCQGELKPIYRDVLRVPRVSGEIMELDEKGDKLIPARPREWLCENCKEMFKIEVVGILC